MIYSSLILINLVVDIFFVNLCLTLSHFAGMSIQLFISIAFYGLAEILGTDSEYWVSIESHLFHLLMYGSNFSLNTYFY